jgi:hypothetical protein
MSEDRDRDRPSLEPPSLFGRKRTKDVPTRDDPVEPVEPVPAGAPDTIFDDTSEPTPDVAPPQVGSPTATGTPSEPGQPLQPWLTGRPAAILTGLVVGVLVVAATSGALRICTEVRGTSSCGRQGFFLLMAILAVAVLVGAALLRLTHVSEPGSTSFLAVGLLSVATLLFLVDSIFEWWMVIAIPLVSMVTFLLAHWVTTSHVDPG